MLSGRCAGSGAKIRWCNARIRQEQAMHSGVLY
jgi:hypothetical protein